MKKTRIGKIQWLILFIFMLSIAVWLGVIPGLQLPNLSLSVWWGSAKDLMNNASWFDFSCDNVGYPDGLEFNEGYSVGSLTRLFLALGGEEVFSLSLCFFAIYLLGAGALFYMLFKISHNYWITLFGMGMYYLIPALGANDVIVPTYFGYLLIPICMLSDYLFVSCILNRKEKIPKTKDTLILGIVAFLTKLLLVATTWYLSVIYAVVSCLVLQFLLILTKRDGVKDFFIDEMLFALLGVLTWMVAMFLIQILMPEGTSDFVYGLVRYNGSSVDLLTTVIPAVTQKLSDYINIYAFVPENGKLTGDAGMHANYLGIAMIGCSIWGVSSKKYRDKYSIVLLGVGIIMLILSLGPALKCGKFIDVNEFAYEVKMDDQLVFPWKNMYLIFPLSKMRTTYRWIFGTYICLVVNFVHTISKVMQDKKYQVVGILLMCLAFVEYFPNDVVNTVKERFENYNMAVQQKIDLCDEIRPYVEEESVVVLSNFGSSQNCYLSACIGSGLDIRIWNVTGDKNVEMFSNTMPEEIQGIIAATSPEDLTYYTDMVLVNGQADYVIFPTFNLRTDVYVWPETQETRAQRIENMNVIESILEEKYSCIRTEHYLIVSK